MLLVLAIAGAVWGAGLLTGAPVRLRLAGIALLWLGVVLGHLVLPEGHGLRLATGGSAAPWLLLGGMVALVMGYRAALGWLKRRVHVPEAVVQEGPFREAELRRYARHIILREVGGPGQVKLKKARVLVIGAGGLGSPALMYLAASGVGTIGLIDDDAVDATNLQRQVIHGDADIGRPKVQSATDRLRGLNPFVEIRPYGRRLVAEEAEALGKPLISGALTQWEGQVSVFDPASGAPCYQCVFPEAPAPGLAPSCAEAGVIGPLPGVVGSMMAVEAVKVLTGAGMALRGEMLIYDALWGETRKIRVKPRADCPVCRGRGLAEGPGRA